MKMPGQSAQDGAPRGYHHGDLRQTLIATAEALLEEKGVEGFTLRECARRAGVSPAAPAHHFGNVTGLLTAIATLGFEGLARSMEEAAAASDGSPDARLAAIGQGYIRFALAHPARFRVMFGRFVLKQDDPGLAEAGARGFALLTEAIAARRGAGGLDDAGREEFVTAWSLVHGFACLALDGHLPFVDGKGDAVMDFARALTGLLPRRFAATDEA